MASVKQKKKGEGWIVGWQALHSVCVGLKINLFVAVTMDEFSRAVLYTGAQLNSEVTWVPKNMEVHVIPVSCDTSLCCEDMFFHAEVTLSEVSPVWFFAATVLASIQTYLRFVSCLVCFSLVVTATCCISFFLHCFMSLWLLEQHAGEIRELCLFPLVHIAVRCTCDWYWSCQVQFAGQSDAELC